MHQYCVILWMSDELKEKKAIEYGTFGGNDSSNGDAIKARLGIGTAPTTGNIMNTKDVYGKRFCIPLDFELFTTIMPFHQSDLGLRIEYRLTLPTLTILYLVVIVLNHHHIQSQVWS